MFGLYNIIREIIVTLSSETISYYMHYIAKYSCSSSKKWTCFRKVDIFPYLFIKICDICPLLDTNCNARDTVFFPFSRSLRLKISRAKAVSDVFFCFFLVFAFLMFLKDKIFARGYLNSSRNSKLYSFKSFLFSEFILPRL